MLLRRDNLRMLGKLSVITLGMFAFGYALVPIYRHICEALGINVRKVIGGSVVSFRTYDRARDRSDERHYIITDEQEFDRELGKIITMESMRQS